MVLIVFYGFLWSFWRNINLIGFESSFCGLLWQNIDLIGLESSFLTVIDPNSFGLVLCNLEKKFLFLKELVCFLFVFCCRWLWLQMKERELFQRESYQIKAHKAFRLFKYFSITVFQNIWKMSWFDKYYLGRVDGKPKKEEKHYLGQKLFEQNIGKSFLKLFKSSKMPPSIIWMPWETAVFHSSESF